jgi:hypothetical protein
MHVSFERSAGGRLHAFENDDPAHQTPFLTIWNGIDRDPAAAVNLIMSTSLPEDMMPWNLPVEVATAAVEALPPASSATNVRV